MACELKPETLAKKRLAYETLPEFLARMTLVWEARQRRLANAPAKAAEVSKRCLERAMQRDPEGTKARRREASRRYEARNREAIRAREARQRARLGAALKVARAIKEAEKAAQREANKARGGMGAAAPMVNDPRGTRGSKPTRCGAKSRANSPAMALQSALSRAWSGQPSEADPRLEKRSSAASE